MILYIKRYSQHVIAAHLRSEGWIDRVPCGAHDTYGRSSARLALEV